MKSDLLGYLTIGLSVLIGGGALVIFMVFLYMGALNIVLLELDTTGMLWLDFSLCLAFFTQHSSMIRRAIRQRIESLVRPYYYGAIFSISSGIVLLLLVILWQESERIVADFEGIAGLLLRLMFVVSIAGLVWSARSLSSFDIVGKDQIKAHIHRSQLPLMPFTVQGPYRFVRHPFYFFMLMMIWSSPGLSLDRLLFNCLWSIWIVLGTILEERDLVANLGTAYTGYQKKVPMLLPWRICAKPFGYGT